jgi:hypothetical protein
MDSNYEVCAVATYDPEDQAERRRVLRNDARVREQSRNRDTSAYIDHAHSELGGRYAITEHATITGVVSPSPPPLPDSSPWAGRDPVPDEPPLGYEIDRIPESESAAASILPVADTDDPASAPSGGSGSATSSGGLMSEPAGSSFSSEDES